MVFSYEFYIGVGFVERQWMGAIKGVVNIDSAGVFVEGKKITGLEESNLDVLFDGHRIFGGG